MVKTIGQKFNDFKNHIREVLCYLVFEFGYNSRSKQKNDLIPKAVEILFPPTKSHKSGTNRIYRDATLTYGLDNNHKPYVILNIKGVPIEIPDLPARKMAKIIDFYINDMNS